MGGQHHTPSLYHWDKLVTISTGGWLFPKASLDGYGKSPPLGCNPQTVHPIARRYINNVTPKY